MNARPYVLSLLVLSLGCGGDDDEEPARTPAEFCSDWAEAACSPETVSACQAADAASCRKSQAVACLELVPETFSDEMGDACIAGVKAAFADGDLRGDELATVGRLAGPCASIIRGPKAKGQACSTTVDCQAGGLTCVRKADQAQGTCQIAEEVAGGRDCEAPQKSCAAGFYCDGENCLEAKDEGDSCTIPEECGPDRFCGDAGKCEEGRKTGADCDEDYQCITGICLEYDGKMSCTDRIVLTRSDPVCDDLR